MGYGLRWHPVKFYIDASGVDVTLGPFINPNCGTPPEDPVTYTIAVRATDSCVPPNIIIFDTCELTVDTCTPVSVGNIILRVNRLGLALKWAVDESGPFTVEWTDPGGGFVEYAVYVDTDPSDGLTNDLFPAGTTTGLNFIDSNTSFPADHYVVGWTYIVRGRTQAGNPLSEGLDSEPAFVAFNGWETLARFANPGIGNNGEGWLVSHESNTGQGIYGLHFPRAYDDVTHAHPAHGIHSLQYSPWCSIIYPDLAGRWNGILMETPVIPNSSIRFIEFEMYGWQFWPPDGMAIGTSPQHAFDSFDITTFDWSTSETAGDYFGYNTESSDVSTWFEDVEPGVNNAWQILAGPFTSEHRLFGGNCNADGNPGDPYIGIQYIRVTNAGQPYPMLDELAVVIY